TGVGRVTASDKDASAGNNQVLYMLDASSALIFEINAVTGQITVTDQLDREVNEFYNIIVTAFDNGFPSRASTAVVRVEVLDANDTPPRFIW
ncbi:cadherin-23, partial [Biomphalaria glabrata]